MLYIRLTIMSIHAFIFTDDIAHNLVEFYYKCCGELGDYRENLFHYNPFNYFKTLITKYDIHKGNKEMLYKNTDKLFELIGVMVDYIIPPETEHMREELLFSGLMEVIKNKNNISDISEFNEESYENLYNEVMKKIIKVNEEDLPINKLKEVSTQLSKSNELLIELLPMMRMPSQRQIIVIWNSFKQEFISNNGVWGHYSKEPSERIKKNPGGNKLYILYTTYNSLYPALMDNLWFDFIQSTIFHLYEIYVVDEREGWSHQNLQKFLEQNLVIYNE